jgi:hypothetical protein
MAKKIIRLTEADLVRLVKKAIKEERYLKHDKLNRWTSDDDDLRNFDTLPGEDSDYDEEVFDNYHTFSQKYPDSKPHSRGWGGQNPEDVFGMYKNMYGDLRVKTRRNMEESEEEDYFEGQEDNTDLVSLVRDRLASLPNNGRKIKVLEAIKSIIDMEIRIIRREN